MGRRTRVRRTFRREFKFKGIWQLQVEGDGENATFEVTSDHPWYVEKMGWTETAALQKGQRIATADGRGVLVIELVATDRVEQTYNIEVDGFHIYLVGNAGVIVHNADCNEAKRELAKKGIFAGTFTNRSRRAERQAMVRGRGIRI